MLLHVESWREEQRDVALLKCELWKILLLTGETSLGQTRRKHYLNLDFI